VTDAVKDLKTSVFYCPGSILHVDYAGAGGRRGC
jgi:hypothetical protein